MEYRLSKFKHDIANQFGLTVFYNNVLIRVIIIIINLTSIFFQDKSRVWTAAS